MSERWPPPNDPQNFESLCADLWGSIWGQAAQKNGRSGQAQAGVDVYGRCENEWIGIQCKKKDGLLRSKLMPAELVEEVKAARQFTPPLRRFIVATTGPTDAKVQETARSLTEEHARQGLFEVEVWSWPEIWAELSRRPSLLQTIAPVYWPRLVFVANEEGRRNQTEQLLQAIQSPLLPCGLFLSLKYEVSDEIMERVYGGQTGFRSLPTPHYLWKDAISSLGATLTCEVAMLRRLVFFNRNVLGTTSSIRKSDTQSLGLTQSVANGPFQKTSHCSCDPA